MPDRIKPINQEINTESRKIVKGDFKDLFGACNIKLESAKAGILLFEKNNICTLLNQMEIIPNINSINSESCLCIDRPIKLVGFILSPVGS